MFENYPQAKDQTQSQPMVNVLVDALFYKQ